MKLPSYEKVLTSNNIDWVELICKSSYWVTKDAFDKITELNGIGAPGVFFPYCVRRGNRASRGQCNPQWLFEDGQAIYVDLNAKPQDAISLIMTGKTYSSGCKGYTCCHVHGNPYTQDPNSFTNVGNFFLVPRVMQAFTDYHPDVKECMEWISENRYGWKPEGKESVKKDYSKYAEIVNEIETVDNIEEIYKKIIKKYKEKCKEKGYEVPF